MSQSSLFLSDPSPIIGQDFEVDVSSRFWRWSLVEILKLKCGRGGVRVRVWFRDLGFWSISFVSHILFYLKTFLFQIEKNCPHHLSLVKSYDPLIRSVPGWIAKLERNFDVGLAGLDKFGNRILNFLLPWGSRYIWWKYIKKIKNTRLI